MGVVKYLFENSKPFGNIENAYKLLYAVKPFSKISAARLSFVLSNTKANLT